MQLLKQPVGCESRSIHGRNDAAANLSLVKKCTGRTTFRFMNRILFSASHLNHVFISCYLSPSNRERRRTRDPGPPPG